MMVSGRSLETATALMTGAFGAAVDPALLARLDPLRVLLPKVFPEIADRDVETGEIALASGQRFQALDAAAEL